MGAAHGSLHRYNIPEHTGTALAGSVSVSNHYSRDFGAVKTLSFYISLREQLDLHLDSLTLVAYLWFPTRLVPQSEAVAFITAFETESNRLASKLLAQHNCIDSMRCITWKKSSRFEVCSVTVKAAKCMFSP